MLTLQGSGSLYNSNLHSLQSEDGNSKAILFHEWMKEGCLFVCFSCHTLGTIGMLLMSTGAQNSFYYVFTSGEEVIEYWIFFSLQIYLNQN